MAELKNLKVTEELLREINIECAQTGLKQYELAEKAMNAYLDAKIVVSNEVILNEHSNPADVRLRLLFEKVISGITAKDRKVLTGLLEIIEVSQKLGVSGE